MASEVLTSPYILRSQSCDSGSGDQPAPLCLTALSEKSASQPSEKGSEDSKRQEPPAALPPPGELGQMGRDAFSVANLSNFLQGNVVDAGLNLLGGFKEGFSDLCSLATQSCTELLLDNLEKAHFKYFQEYSHPATGLTYDRSDPASPCSIAGVGFSLSSHLAAANRNWISRDQAADYTLKVLRTLANAPQGDQEDGVSGHKGFFYHFIDPATGKRAGGSELSTVDTAILMAGVLSSGTYFDKDTEQEKEIRSLAKTLYERVDWNWAMRGKEHMSMGWYPDKGFIEHEWKGYNEGMLMLVLGMASPTHPISAKAWDAYTKSYKTEQIDNKPFISFAPLFGHQYSHAWIDFRGIKDDSTRKLGCDYFENSQRATLAQQRYAITNPCGWRGYSALDWGLTACDGPGLLKRDFNGREVEYHGYRARGPGEFDDGTIAPTAAVASLPFAPKEVVATLTHWLSQRPEIYSRIGFRDAFNPSFEPSKPSGWVAPDSLAIDQGPIVMMIENHRSNFIWDLMRRNDTIRTGLLRGGFKGGWLDK